MNLRDLRYVAAVAEHGHFGKAADACFVSQPTLSGQIKKLEEQLGVALFERDNRNVYLTECGEEIVKIARRMLQDAAAIEEHAAAAQQPLGGRFRLGAFPTLSPFIFPPLVQKVKQQLPDMQLVLVEEKTEILLEKLKAAELDAALLALPIMDASLAHKALFDDPFYVATAPNHPLAAQKHVTQQMLAVHPLLLLEEGHCLRDQALEWCQIHQLGETQDVRATGIETLREMVKAGTGITLMPGTAIKETDADICYIPFAPPAPSRTVGLFWRKSYGRLALIDAMSELVGVR